MVDRRPLIDGLKPKSEINRSAEEEFVFGNKVPPNLAAPREAASEPQPPRPAAALSRVPLTTRVRTDLAQALKRASLERQLQGVEPHTVQDLLEGALEPWLRDNGYLG